MLRPGRGETWHSFRIPEKFSSDDRVFFWESAPAVRVIGLGTVTKAHVGKDEKTGDSLFRVRYLTRRLQWMPDIHLLRTIPALADASFLKSGPATAISPLTEVQGILLYQVIAARNSRDQVWPDIFGAAAVPDIELSVREGDLRLVAHVRRERDRGIIEQKKADFVAKNGRLFCECCGFDFERIYGPVGAGVCEVHHRRPLAEAKAARVTRLVDLAVLCPNCHRVIHRTSPMLTVGALARKVGARSFSLAERIMRSPAH